MIAHIVLPVVGIYLVIRRDRYTSRFWVAFLAGTALYAIVDIVGAMQIHARFAEVMQHTSTTASDASSSAQTTNLRTLLFTVIWIGYWSRSERVRQTFGSRAFDKPVISPPTHELPESETTSVPIHTS